VGAPAAGPAEHDERPAAMADGARLAGRERRPATGGLGPGREIAQGLASAAGVVLRCVVLGRDRTGGSGHDPRIWP